MVSSWETVAVGAREIEAEGSRETEAGGLREIEAEGSRETVTGTAEAAKEDVRAKGGVQARGTVLNRKSIR